MYFFGTVNITSWAHLLPLYLRGDKLSWWIKSTTGKRKNMDFGFWNTSGNHNWVTCFFLITMNVGTVFYFDSISNTPTCYSTHQQTKPQSFKLFIVICTTATHCWVLFFMGFIDSKYKTEYHQLYPEKCSVFRVYCVRCLLVDSILWLILRIYIVVLSERTAVYFIYFYNLIYILDQQKY